MTGSWCLPSDTRVRAFSVPGGDSGDPLALTGAMIYAVSSTAWAASAIAWPTG